MLDDEDERLKHLIVFFLLLVNGFPEPFLLLLLVFIGGDGAAINNGRRATNTQCDARLGRSNRGRANRDEACIGLSALEGRRWRRVL